MTPSISPEQRYRNPVRKARIRLDRDLRAFMAGRLAILEGAYFERDEIIAAIGRAYRDGARDAQRVAS